MKQMRSCPKCEEEGIEPEWHYSCNSKDNISRSKEEHLHYFCSCGYDFIVLVPEDRG